MQKSLHIILIIVFFILFGFALYLIFNNFICDDHGCRIFVCALENKSKKEQALHLIENLLEDGIWPFAFIASAISTGFILAILPITISVQMFAITFLLSLLTFYAIILFMIHHYVVPVKKYIKKYIESINNKDDNDKN